MSGFSRMRHNPIITITEQELATIQTAMLKLLRQCESVALITVALHFPESTPHHARQESAVILCQQLRQSIRGSDLIYLENGTEHYRLFFVLPEADLDGGSTVQARLETVFLSDLPHLPVQPRSVMHTYASLGQDSLVEEPTYTDLSVNQDDICIQHFPTSTQQSSMFSLHTANGLSSGHTFTRSTHGDMCNRR